MSFESNAILANTVFWLSLLPPGRPGYAAMRQSAEFAEATRCRIYANSGDVLKKPMGDEGRPWPAPLGRSAG